MHEPRVVRRRFKGPTLAGDDGVFWYDSGMVVDVAEWRNAEALERGGYIRRLEYGENFADAGSGIPAMVTKGAGAQVTGRERASSSQNNDSATPAPSDPVTIEEEAEEEQDEPPVVEHIGGGWYNITVNGVAANDSPIQGKAAAQAFADEL